MSLRWFASPCRFVVIGATMATGLVSQVARPQSSTAERTVRETPTGVKPTLIFLHGFPITRRGSRPLMNETTTALLPDS